MLSIYQTGIHSLLLPDSSGTPQGQKGIESGQKVAKVNIYFLAFVFSREFWRPQTAKSKHIFEMWCWCVVSCVPLVVVSTGCRWCAPAPSLWVCSVPFLPAFALFPAFLSRFAFRICPYLAFLGGFSALWGADVCLYGLRSLR